MADKNYLHTAYAYSADGTDRFTTVYPNLNLLDGTAFDSYVPKTEQYLTTVIKSGGAFNKPYVSASYNNPAPSSFADILSWTLDKEHFKPSTTYTFSFYLKGKGTIKTYIHPSLIDTSSNNSFADGKLIKPNVDGEYVWNLTNEWVRRTYMFTTKSSITEGQYVLFRLLTGNSADICVPKVEEGTIDTSYMQSASEVTTADWPKFVGTYVDTNPVSSTVSSKYDWNEMKYRVYLDGTPVGGSKLLSFDLENLKADISYNVQVSQINGNVESDKSESVAFKTTLTK